MIPRLGRQLSAWATSLRTKVCHRFVSLRLPDAKPLWATVNLHGAPVRPTPGGQRPLPVRRTRSTPEYQSEALPFGLFAPKFAENIGKCKFAFTFSLFLHNLLWFLRPAMSETKTIYNTVMKASEYVYAVWWMPSG